VDTTKAGFFGVSLYSNLVETVFLGKSGAANETNWRLEGKSPNTTALSTVNADDLAFLVVRIDWNYDGQVGGDSRPLTPDTMYLWINPDLRTEPDISTALVSTRNVTVTNQIPFLYFNRVGFRGATSGGAVDEFRLGTTFRSVVPGLLLSIARSGNSVVIRWKTADGATLQGSPTASNPTWTTVSATPVIEGDDSVVTLSDSGDAQFFQLVK
jgi:hypothetical protein